ncbi:hypothetical protein CCHL11_02948 [Colletotrichum chlorophyti]|uniref:Zn(2)-C6 fungal-type domain-containing protein n=1 Tax=Colletotrichum chlorophyti TaxID=708187 RepID=A0A1Q8S158_9PEZI|nr:hypothetical protein CCHL11_02948 [Colletotrichum chlorophyti]
MFSPILINIDQPHNIKNPELLVGYQTEFNGCSPFAGPAFAHLLMVGYHPISGSVPNDLNYGTNRPYAAEKPPTAEASQTAAYAPVHLPTTLVPNEAASFTVPDAGMMNNYVHSYQQPLLGSPNQALVPQPTGTDDLLYQGQSSASTYYQNVPNVPTPVGVHSLPNDVDHHPVTVEPRSATYGDNAMRMPPALPIYGPPRPPITKTDYHMASKHEMLETCVKCEDADPSSLDVVFANQRPPASKRGPFKDQQARKETAETRKNGSCIRCKFHRVRCRVDPENPKGPCLNCKPKANTNHHKQVIRQPCVRHKITECNFFKRGQAPGYEWTQRWVNGIVDNINNWASSDVKTIHVWEGYTDNMSVQLHVREFVPQQGDKLERSWVANGVKKSVPIPPFAITDLDEAQTAYQNYIKRGVVECFNSVVKSVMGARDHLLFATYRKAWELSQDPRTAQDERELLTQTLELWMAVRLTTKSIEIVGNETLGMRHDILDRSSPQHGSIPVPPVMGAQLDMVLIQHIQTRLRREMLEKLQKMTLQNKQKTWLTTYLVNFILLHNIALVTDHDERYARKHGMNGIYPFSEECRDQDLRSLAQLDEQALQFIHWTRAQALAHSK